MKNLMELLLLCIDTLKGFIRNSESSISTINTTLKSMEVSELHPFPEINSCYSQSHSKELFFLLGNSELTETLHDEETEEASAESPHSDFKPTVQLSRYEEVPLYLDNTEVADTHNDDVIVADVEGNSSLLTMILEFTSYGHDGYEKSISWLMQRILPAISVGFLIGESQSFKSFIAVSIAACISSGRDFGVLKVPKPRLVFYIAAEGGGSIPRRIKAEVDNYGEVGEQFIVIKKPINFNKPNDMAMLSSLIFHEELRQGVSAGLVIVDTLSQCAAGMDENSSADVALYLSACTEFAVKHGVTILNVHHNNRKGEYRGSGALFANSDFVLIADRKKKNVLSTILSIDKLKDASTEYKFTLNLEKHDLGLIDEFDEAVDTLSLSRPEVISPTEEPEEGLSKKISKSQLNEEWLQTTLQSMNCEKVTQLMLIETYMQHFNQTEAGSKQAVYRAVATLSEKSTIRTESSGKTKFISLI
jgi:hypothetical protein